MVEEGEQLQPELFQELGKVPRRFRRRKLRLPRGLAITISYENLVFGAILVVMSMVVCFTLGIERGRRIGLEGTRAEPQPVAGDKSQEASVQLTTGPIGEEAVSSTSAKPHPDKSGRGKPEISSTQAPLDREAHLTGQVKSQTYAIQLITYARQNYAEAERAKLKEDGFTPYIVRAGRYFVVYIGPYSSKEEAQSILKEFKSQAPYRSALLKELPQ